MRRRRRRKLDPYGPHYHITTIYTDTFDIVKKTIFSVTFPLTYVAFGNDKIFSQRYANLSKTFREYKVLSVHLEAQFEVVKSSTWTASKHPNTATFAVCLFIEDWDAETLNDKTGSLTWNDITTHPEVKHSIISTGGIRRLSVNWRPTESNDSDWRLTTNDGVFYIYLASLARDNVTTEQFVKCTLSMKSRLLLRGLVVQNPKSVLASLNALALAQCQTDESVQPSTNQRQCGLELDESAINEAKHALDILNISSKKQPHDCKIGEIPAEAHSSFQHLAEKPTVDFEIVP